ncbi:hypothetical protein DEO72_LG9g1138 [Vigna unguiculata]|uniref:Uncharacterized protein n=1 Tax=Vigna unguiculata TaxID=3917 RepID=A0A4D6N299_VIGUN|nr:hypothetical protein DEO72_LG9g1138 [Vigna unguiculata]
MSDRKKQGHKDEVEDNFGQWDEPSLGHKGEEKFSESVEQNIGQTGEQKVGDIDEQNFGQWASDVHTPHSTVPKDLPNFCSFG